MGCALHDDRAARNDSAPAHFFDAASRTRAVDYHRAVGRVVAAGCGFLLAVLWFDLMHDTQLLRADETAAIAVIRAYYRQVTREAGPMAWLVGAVMVVTSIGAWVETGGRLGRLALLYGPVACALALVVPWAEKLGAGTGSIALDRTLAWRILCAHVACFVSVGAFLAMTLVGA